MKEKKKPRYVNPPNILKQKVGGGGIPDTALEKGQEVISTNKIDFAPYAENYLTKLSAVINDFTQGKLNNKEVIEKLADPVMQLKANGGMFNYELITRIADTVLLLLDNIPELNEDALKIIRAHQDSLQIIVASRLRGTGGREGIMLENELSGACARFYKKYGITPQ